MTRPSSPRPCPECGKPLPAADAHPVCPACLLAQAFASGTAFDPGAPAATSAEPPPPPPTPEQIADKFPLFEILQCLGHGGMGVVYKARQKSLNRLVAIKILAPGRERDARFAERFAREAELLARLSHPHIVTIHDFGETGGLFYIVMEFVDGVNLRDLIRDGKLEVKQALAIVPPICEALQYAHDQGVVHRDIKPENLLLDRAGRIKIADFGIAALVGSGDGERAGTPAYMAPEQNGAIPDAPAPAVDHRADIYALGVVLYEMLTGERPSKDVVAPSKKVLIDVRLDEIVLRALEKSPSLRYQTAGEFRTRVETVVAKDGCQGVPSGRRISLTKLVGASLALLALLALTGVPAFYKYSAGTTANLRAQTEATLQRNRATLDGEASATMKPILRPAAIPGLVAWWSAENNGDDRTGRHPGTFPYGSAFAPGVEGAAFDFDGGQRRLNVPDSPDFAPTKALTVSAWIKPRRLGGFIAFRGDNRTGLDSWFMDAYGGNGVKFGIDDKANHSDQLAAPLRLDVWQHVAGTWDRATGTLRLYVDGTLVAERHTDLVPIAGLDPTQEPAIGIGNHGGTFHQFPFDGLIDEVRIYRRALTPDEIATLHRTETSAAILEQTNPQPAAPPSTEPAKE